MTEIRSSLSDIRAIPNLWRYWIGQLVSDIGSEATLFVLMTYVYLETGSLTQFALLFAIDNVPDLVLSPVAGVLVDRHDRRILHIVGDGGVAVATAGALGLLVSGNLTVASVYVLVLIGSTFEVIQGAAAEAMYQEMVPPDKLVRTSAILGSVDEMVDVVGPAIGVGMFALAGAGTVFAFDLATFAVAMYTLFTLSSPEVFRPATLAGTASIDSGRESDVDSEHDTEVTAMPFFLEGVRFLRNSPGMRVIFAYSVVDEFLLSVAVLVVAGAAIELGGQGSLAVVQGSAGAGAIAGLVVVALLGLRRPPIIARNVVAPGLVIGAVLVAGALPATTTGLAAAAFVVMALSAPLDSALEATSLASIPKPLIGRVSAVFDVAGGIGNLVLLLGIAPLIEFALEPALAEGRLPVAPLLSVRGEDSAVTALLLVLAVSGLGYLALNLAAVVAPGAAAAEQLATRIATSSVGDPESESEPSTRRSTQA